MTTPLVTILYPTAHTNREAFLFPRAYQAVKQQSVQSWRLNILLVGDGDRHRLYLDQIALIEHMRQYAAGINGTLTLGTDTRVNISLRPRVQSLGLALNMALAHADPATEWIAFCNDDSEWDPDYLAAMLDGNPDPTTTGMIFCQESEFDNSRVPVLWTPRIDYDRLVLFHLYYMHLPAMLISYPRLVALGGFDALNIIAPDWDLALRLSRFGVRQVKRPLVRRWWPYGRNPQVQIIEQARESIHVALRAGLYGPEALAQATTWRSSDDFQKRE